MLTDREILEIRAILDLKAMKTKVWSDSEICRLLGFSERTYRRRMAKKDEFKRQHRPTMAAVAVAC